MMVHRLRAHLTYANVVSTLCLFVLLGGGAYAATKLGKDSVGSKQIKANAVKRAELADNAVTSPKVADGSLGTQDFAPGQLPQGPKGDPGEPGPPGPSGLSGGSIPSGTTVTGVWGGRYVNALAGSQTNSYLLPYSFPLPAPAALSDGQVNFGANTPDPVGDPDPACVGSADNPTAPPGKVCIYVNDGTRDNSTLTGFKLTAAGGFTNADRYGFEVRIVNVNAGGTNGGTIRAEGTWAYTAP